MLFPSRETFLADTKKYRYVPIALPYMADLETPISICMKLGANTLLESVEKGDSMGRYSIIATHKKQSFTIRGNKVRVDYYQNKPDRNLETVINSDAYEVENPIAELKRWRISQSAPHYPELPPFAGGLVGYVGYETVHHYEPSVPIHSLKEGGGDNESNLNIPDAILYFHEIVIVYDNVKKQATLIKVCGPFEKEIITEKIYDDAVVELKALRDYITYTSPSPKSASPTRKATKKLSTLVESNCTQAEFEEMVNKAIEYIKAGEIIQVVPSQRFVVKTELAAFEIYRTLKTRNPSPYLYYFNFGDFYMIGSSPEVMVRVRGDELLLKPIAGTRPRGDNQYQDDELARELLEDEKEKAEHLMLVDLGRNDLSRVAETGSVRVSDYMSIEKYSQVQHIVSSVTATKKPEYDAMDVLEATFPAGTLSGAPKVRALQIIHELEKERRGIYGGAVLYYSLNGDLDSCITIRTILLKNQHAYIQAGAGVVLDSVPQNEYQETVNKAKALVNAINETEARLSRNSEQGN